MNPICFSAGYQIALPDYLAAIDQLLTPRVIAITGAALDSDCVKYIIALFYAASDICLATTSSNVYYICKYDILARSCLYKMVHPNYHYNIFSDYKNSTVTMLQEYMDIDLYQIMLYRHQHLTVMIFAGYFVSGRSKPTASDTEERDLYRSPISAELAFYGEFIDTIEFRGIYCLPYGMNDRLETIYNNIQYMISDCALDLVIQPTPQIMQYNDMLDGITHTDVTV